MDDPVGGAAESLKSASVAPSAPSSFSTSNTSLWPFAAAAGGRKVVLNLVVFVRVEWHSFRLFHNGHFFCCCSFTRHSPYQHHDTYRHRGVIPVVNDGNVSSAAQKQPNTFRVTFVSSFSGRVQGAEVKARRAEEK